MERIGNEKFRVAQSSPGRAMLIRSIEKFLRAYDVSATTFGRLTVQDPRFVFDLRNGREPRPDTEARIQAFIAGYQAAWEATRAA